MVVYWTTMALTGNELLGHPSHADNSVITITGKRERE
jgi:hypothetical protein